MTTKEAHTESTSAFYAMWRERPFGADRCPLCGAGGPFHAVPRHEDQAALCGRCHDQVATRFGLRARPHTAEAVLKRWPRLVAHLICTSLGYFTPRAAASALLAYRDGATYACEWYAHQFGLGRAALLAGNASVVAAAVADRARHHGYMTDYATARRLVEAELFGRGPTLASWF